MQAPLVSIITPCHNSAEFIGEAIESVLAQDYQNWEMLITDDGSTDHSIDVVERYAEKDARIRFFKLGKASGSPAAPRNNSIREAKGKYIAFLDSDDIWVPNKLSDQVNFAENNGYSVVYSYYEKMCHNGERSGRVVKTGKLYSYNDIVKTDGVPWLTLMIRKDAVEGLEFIKEDKEDYIYLMALLRKGYTAHNTCKLHAFYREAQTSRSGNKLKMLYGQWNAIRKYEHIGILKSIYCLAVYAVCGLRKYVI